ncbi:MAG: pyridoxal phosphate-dependent class II aminotransferase, partial [Spirochaetales bacterium]|nr:pyridoxal phosphate-dependent class II aminotransferase [Spirochaetales bacterium]
ANINPLGFPSWLRKEINRNIETLIHYPDPEQKEIRKAAAKHFSINSDRVIYGNGASEFISILPDILGIDHMIIPVPSYSEYKKSSRNVEISYLKLKEETGFTLTVEALNDMLDSPEGKTLVFIGQPNNPTGKTIPVKDIVNLAENNKDTFFCIDESFADFIPGYHSIARTAIAVRDIPNIIVIRSLTKFYGIPGLRLGLCLADPDIIHKIRKSQIPWSVNTLALKVGEKLFNDTQFFIDSVKTMTILRTELSKKLKTISWIKPFRGEANFILIKISYPEINIKELYSYFAGKGIIIRTCDSFEGLDDSYFRIAVRTSNENEQLIKILTSFSEEILSKKKIGMIKTYTPPFIRKKALPLMIQG